MGARPPCSSGLLAQILQLADEPLPQDPVLDPNVIFDLTIRQLEQHISINTAFPESWAIVLEAGPCHPRDHLVNTPQRNLKFRLRLSPSLRHHNAVVVAVAVVAA